MPNPNLSDQEAAEVIAFLAWVSNIDNNSWPPRPILVSAATPQEAAFGTQVSASSEDPIALGEALFRQSPPACFSCHSTQPGVQVVGPSLAGLASRAAETLTNRGYTGAAHTPEQYIRESILHPNAYVVPGPTFSAGGQSVMPSIYDTTLKPADIDHLVAYLVTLK
jgi:nitric oxide reductase subunit C